MTLEAWRSYLVWPRVKISFCGGSLRVVLHIQGVPFGISSNLMPPGDILEFDGDLCTALWDVLLHKLKMAGALISLEVHQRYGYFWNQGIKLHHIGGCHFWFGSDTLIRAPLNLLLHTSIQSYSYLACCTIKVRVSFSFCLIKAKKA